MLLLDILPPSPPTTSSRKITSDGLQSVLAPQLVMTTPEDSPASMPGSSNQGSRKKVEFCAQPNVYDAAVFASSPEQAASIKALPPSREHRGGRRSILKPSSQTEMPFQGLDAQQENKLSVNENMDSIVQQLSKDDKPTSLDAYNTLASLFRAYDELPEAIVLKNKLSTLIKYIRRDLGSQDKADDEATDANLILSALKLLIILVWNSAYSPLLSDEAKTFILDRSIHVVSEHRASKNIIAHYLHLLSTQNFRPPIMAANNRAGRLLDALKELPNHVSSSAVVSETIMVLGRLTDQARSVMRAKADCWVEILLRTMTTPSRDTRQKAILFGMKACSAFATTPSVSAAFRDMLKRESDTDTDTTLEVNTCKRLKAMFMKPEDAVLVPQVWATVLLLAVNSTESINEWTSLKNCWLEIIQKCFNSSEIAVRVQANFAWNRLVCLARPHQASDFLASLLGKPVAGQMERSGRDKQGHDSRMSALSSYCNLLYYAFRPAATHKEYTRSWNEYVVKILRRSFFQRNASNADFACRIFMALTWNSTRVTKVWKDTRAHDNTTIEPEELPTIDAKWIRKNCGTVLQMFRLLFSHSTWGSSNTFNQNYVAGAWKHFAKSLGDSASKEIKASPETVQACAQVVKLVEVLWKEGPRAVNASDMDTEAFAERLSFLLRVVIAELGAAPFIDVLDDRTVCLPAVLLRTFAATAVQMRHGPQKPDVELGAAFLPPKAGTPTLLLLEKSLHLLNKRLFDAYKGSDLDRRDMDNALELLRACLCDAPENVRLLTLQTMQSSLQCWLEDTYRSSAMAPVLEIARVDMAVKFTSVVVPSLGKLPHSAVSILDGLFAAGFSSTHKDTINQMVDMWNATHGQALQMAYGPSLISALTRLRPYVDIDLVDLHVLNGTHLADAIESTAPPAFLDFVESQPQLLATAPNHGDGGIPEDLQRQKRHSDDSNIQGIFKNLPLAQNLEATTTSRPQSSHSTPQRRRQHNDSQIQFEPIDSSPFNGMQEESQYLTERQKEVRDRQRQDASVYFSDLKADIAPRLLHNAVPTPELGRRALIQELRSSTPTLPDRGLADFDNNSTASPTPRSKHQALRLEDIEAPSSPLSMQADEDHIHLRDLGTDESKDGGVEQHLEKLAMEDLATQDGPVATLSKVQQDSLMQRGTSDADAENTQPTESAAILNNVVQTTNGVCQNEPKVTFPERQYDQNAISSTREEAEPVLITEYTQSELPSPHSSPIVPSPTRLDSDEFDLMSQSQLSQDLVLHVSEHEDTPELAVADNEPVQPARSSPAATVLQKKRKRNSSLYAGPKRKKSRSVSHSLSNTSQEEWGEMLDDCIEVDTSSRLPLTEFWTLKRQSGIITISQRASSSDKSKMKTSSAFVNTTFGTDGQRLPASTLLTAELSASHHGLSEERIQSLQTIPKPSFTGLTLADERTSSIIEAGDTTVEVPGRKAGQWHGALVSSDLRETVFRDANAQTTFIASTNAATSTEECEASVQDMAVQTMSAPKQDVGVQAEADIMTSLREALKRLQHSTGKGLDLRELDNLCFHIRTEAQNASIRWACQ